MKSDKLAFLFPGQGAHSFEMLDGTLQAPKFQERYKMVCDALGSFPLRERQKSNVDYINQNVVSSLLTVLTSTLSLDMYVDIYGRSADYAAGYSVGQWTALYATGCLSFESLVRVIKRRAELMDECFISGRGAMMAVIGISPEQVERLCQTMRGSGHEISVSNYNCYGQYSLAGTERAIEVALSEIKSMKPKKAMRLPVSNAWHCSLLKHAAERFGEYLRGVNLSLPGQPIVSNVTGDFFPRDVVEIKSDLARHISHPVYWEKGIKRLIATGCSMFVEIGYGNTLTKFGYFIDRSVTHKAFYIPS